MQQVEKKLFQILLKIYRLINTSMTRVEGVLTNVFK